MNVTVMGRPPYRLLREDDRTRVKYIQQRYERPSGTRELTSGERKYLHDKRREILKVIADLIWFSEELPEDQLCQVFTEENTDKLTSALLTQSRKKSRKTDPNRPVMIEREYRIAAMLMEKGLAKSFERLEIENQNNMALCHLVQQQVAQVILILRYPGRHWSGVFMDYGYDPKDYQKIAEWEEAERLHPHRK